MKEGRLNKNQKLKWVQRRGTAQGHELYKWSIRRFWLQNLGVAAQLT